MSFAYHIGQLRHLYAHLKAGRVGNPDGLADGLLSPVISELERRESMRPGKRMDLEEQVAMTILARRGFAFYSDPMEGGQDAYDISLEALDEARAVLRLLFPGAYQ